MTGNPTRLLLKAGFVPLFWFLIWSTAGAAVAPDYHWVSQQVSELGPLGGMPEVFEQIAGLGTGLFFILFAIGLWRESDRPFALGALAWMVFGIAMLSNGIWRMGGPMHGLYAVGIINLIAPAMACLDSERLRSDRGFYAITAICSLAGVLYLWLNLLGFDPEGYRGLTQRLFSSINSLWPLMAARCLLRRTAA